jgi:poly(A) polymerase
MTLAEFQSLLQELIRDSAFAEHTYLVGGVLRDRLLGKSDFQDFDLCVAQRHGGLKLGAYINKRVSAQSYEIFPRYGTVRLRFAGIELDLVETRRDLYKAGRRFPQIRFTSLDQDVWRRDFTINCLYQKLGSDEILDPCAMGRNDLEHRVIRTPRDPLIVFAEDSLRILRAIRFAATLDFELEPETRAALIHLADRVKQLSHKAQAAELHKMQAARHQADALLKETGVWRYLKPLSSAGAIEK